MDPTRPTNRTLEQPYRAGVNYTSVIDGLLVSPNVEVLGVETVDLEFAHSDHNPVRARLRQRRSARAAATEDEAERSPAREPQEPPTSTRAAPEG